jgi:hypothetical protein
MKINLRIEQDCRTNWSFLGQVVVHVDYLLSYRDDFFLLALVDSFEQLLLKFRFDYLQGILRVDLMIKNVDVLLPDLIFNGE